MVRNMSCADVQNTDLCDHSGNINDVFSHRRVGADQQEMTDFAQDSDGRDLATVRET